VAEPIAHSNRQPELDWLRGLAALAVVQFHYFHKGPKEGWMASQPSALVDAVATYGYLGVHLFFMISGYVIMMSASGASLRQFVASRVSRLVPALWVCMTLTALIELWVPGAPFKPESWSQYLANLTLLPGWFGEEPIDGAYWSLAVEINFYMWVALVIATGQIRHIEKCLLAWLGLSLVNLVRPMYPVELYTSAHWAPLFSAGAFFFLVHQSGWTLQRRVALGFSLVLACLYAWKEAGPLKHVNELLSLTTGVNHLVVMGIMLAYFLFFFRLVRTKGGMRASRWSDLAGRLTYPLYLFHQNAGYALFSLAAASGLVLAWGATTVAVCLVLLALLVAWLVNVLVERRVAPWLRRRIAGRRTMHSTRLPAKTTNMREELP
jgi:peptidoglycan/LPS O-acetylase OafA/YrhL